MTLRTPNEGEITFIDESSNHLSNVISAATTRTMVRKGCESYLAYVIDTVKARSSVSDIPTVSDFPDVFLEELPGLPPHRGIEFAIDVVPGATPASITPYPWTKISEKSAEKSPKYHFSVSLEKKNAWKIRLLEKSEKNQLYRRFFDGKSEISNFSVEKSGVCCTRWKAR